MEGVGRTVPWTALGDETARRPDVRAAGLHGGKLWYTSTTEVAAAGSNGRISALLARDCCYLAGVTAKRALLEIVAAGLWHDADTVRSCGACWDHGGNRVEPGEFFLHEWWKLHFDAAGKDDGVEQWRNQRRKALNRNRTLVTTIRLRDRDLCRYCGVQTIDSSGPNKKGARVRSLDHVDPYCTDGPGGYGNTADNVVVACKACNGRKRDCRPEAAGMTLHEPGWWPDNPAPDPAAGAGNPAPDPASPRVARETGPGRIGSGRPAGSGQVGPDRAGSPSGLGPFDDGAAA